MSLGCPFQIAGYPGNADMNGGSLHHAPVAGVGLCVRARSALAAREGRTALWARSRLSTQETRHPCRTGTDGLSDPGGRQGARQRGEEARAVPPVTLAVAGASG